MSKRRDGVYVKNLDALHSLMPHIKPSRADSDVYMNIKIPCDNLVKYFNKLKKEEKYANLTYFHLFCTAIGKMIYNRPLLNRFIINKKYYDRKKVNVSFVAKRELNDHSEESFTVVDIEKTDNIFTIADKITNNVKTLRENKEHSVDKLMNFIGKSPKWLKSLLVGIVKFADNHDLLPDSLTKDLLYYSTVIVSNLGSIGSDAAIYHNITNFGTNSMMLMIGKVKEDLVIVNGKAIVQYICEFGINLDERIADGFYMIKSLKLFEYILNNPHLLEDDASEPVTMQE